MLNRFDDILGLFTTEYALDKGPQTQPFEQRLLLRQAQAQDAAADAVDKIDLSTFSEEGDRELIESILSFTQLLFDKCGNRSLYSSSAYLNILLNTTSLSLLKATLDLSLCLAQRFHASRVRMHNPHFVQSLLASQYGLNTGRINKMAQPFQKRPQAAQPSLGSLGNVNDQKSSASAQYTADINMLLKGDAIAAPLHTELSNVCLVYYDKTTDAEPATSTKHQSSPSLAEPATPTPAARNSSYPTPGSSIRRDQLPFANEATLETPVRTRSSNKEASNGAKTIEISAAKIANTPSWQIMQEHLVDVPEESQYELLQRVRVAKAFQESKFAVEELLAIRMLSVANLAYVYGETLFDQYIGQADSELPREYQLAQQLSDILQPPAGQSSHVSRNITICALKTLLGLSKNKSRFLDVSTALNTSVSHGIFFYILKNLVSSIASGDADADEDTWRQLVLDLAEGLSLSHTHQRVGEQMVAAGLMGVLVEIMSIKNDVALRYWSIIAKFFDGLVWSGVRDAFQSLVDAQGLEKLTDLAAYAVKTAAEAAANGSGIPAQYRAEVTDYQIPFHHQQVLRLTFKFVAHMFHHNLGVGDRLLRNLVDSVQTLESLKIVISSPSIFGSNVWSGAVNIISHFIHSEPTSYNVVSEAGLTKAILDSITGGRSKNACLTDQSAGSILPVGETMRDIPTAFGAICLNDAGQQMFAESGALETYFCVFLSPNHVQALAPGEPANIGRSFDELVRHHPTLKGAVHTALIKLIASITSRCREAAAKPNGPGVKMLVKKGNVNIVAGGGHVMTGLTSAQMADAHDRGTTDFSTIEQQGSPSIDVEDESADHQTQMAVDSPGSTIEGKSDDKRVDGQGDDLTAMVSATCKFLHGYFSHGNSHASQFCEDGGAELVLDLAMVPSLPYAYNDLGARKSLITALEILVQAKPHLVLPSLSKRTNDVLYVLKPLIEHNGDQAFFSPFTTTQDSPGSLTESAAVSNGTYIVKALVVLQVFCKALAVILESSPISAHALRPNAATYYKLVNLTDMYVAIIGKLGRLHSACIWEEIAIQNSLPSAWNAQTQVHGHFDHPAANDIMGGGNLTAQSKPAEPTTAHTVGSDTEALNKNRSAALRNTSVLRYLLTRVPVSISELFKAMGRNLVCKRPLEAYQKANAELVATHLAKSVIDQLQSLTPKYIADSDARLPYHIVLMASTMQMFFDKPPHVGSTSDTHVLVLQQFYSAGGFDVTNDMLKLYCAKIKGTDESLQQNVIAQILDVYSKVASNRNIESASHAINLATYPGSTSHESIHYWTPSQVIVEIRDAIIEPISSIWNDKAEMLASDSVKLIIDILKSVLDAKGESAALRRLSGRTIPKLHKPVWEPRNQEILDGIVSRGDGISREQAIQALYRCAGDSTAADEYCKLRSSAAKFNIVVPWFPPAEGDVVPAATLPSQLPDVDSNNLRLPDLLPAPNLVPVPGDSGLSSGAPPALERVPSIDMPDAEQHHGDDTTSNTDEPSARRRLPTDMLSDGLSELLRNHTDASRDLLMSVGLNLPADTHESTKRRVTIEDLDEKRSSTRHTLLDRSLDVISIHDITFDLAELVIAAYSSQDEPSAISDIGRTLVQVLISLRPDNGEELQAKKLGSCAHLLALIIQEADFYRVIEEHLVGSFDDLLSLIKLSPEQKLEDAKYISHVLLIMERLLAEDESPSRIQWQAPAPSSPVTLKPRMIADAQRLTLFGAVMELLPKVGKDEAMALSFSRMLVILTRKPEISQKLGQKHSIGSMFLMIKQLAGPVNEKLQGTFLVILRHVVETEGTIRQIMRAEIQKAFYMLKNTSRSMDSTAYTRSLYHLVIRHPELFIEVTNELVRLTRFDSNQTPQALTLKELDPHPEEQGAVANSKPVVPASTSGEVNEVAQKSKASELTPPVQEAPDYVTRFLLKEMFSYKDVDDAEPKEVIDKAAEPVQSDVEMTEQSSSVVLSQTSADASSPSTETTAQPAAASARDKALFKASEHPFYIYKCFLLQCLAELLASYNRSKVEFINFTPKAEHNASTPSKPRSGFLNYLLTSLMPTGTLNHPDDISGRKKSIMSNWAVAVVVALCQKTPETATESDLGVGEEKEEPELMFVRRFVLEHALKSFRDATASTSESTDRRYSRLQILGDLFNRMLQSKSSHQGFATSQKQLGRLMYEKNFVAHLTAAIAEIDMEFPNARRAIKYILRPLKALTETVVELSSSSESPLGGTTDEDEISSATSASDTEAIDREETPDLFRHSTLGQFEARRDDAETGSDSGSEDDDEGDMDEEYEGEYDDYEEGMEYDEEEPEHDHGEVVSDEEDMGSMGEIEGLPGNVNMDLEIVMDDEDGDTGTEGDHDHDHDDDEEDDDEQEEDMDDAMDEDNDDGASDDDDDHDEDEIEWDVETTNLAERQNFPSISARHFDTMVGVLAGNPEVIERLEQDGEDGMEIMMEGSGEYFEDEMPPEEEDDEDQAAYGEDEEIIYEPEVEDDNAGGWGLNDELARLQAQHAHNHSRLRQFLPSSLETHDTARRVYGSHIPRHHRGQYTARGADNGLNPLLRRENPYQYQPAFDFIDHTARTAADDGFAFPSLPPGDYTTRTDFRLRPAVGEVPSFMNDLIDLIGPTVRSGYYPAVGGHVSTSAPMIIAADPGGETMPLPGGAHGWPRIDDLRRMTGLHNPSRPSHGASMSDASHAVSFMPRSTVERWQDEARLLFSGDHPNKAHEIIEFILKLLTPAAMEAKRKRDEIEAERRAAEEKAREEERIKLEAERKVREEAERKEREEREAREAAEAAERANNQVTSDETAAGGAGTNAPEASSESAAPEAPAERVTIMIRGRELNITDLGIDREYIEALPEDIREEVIMQQLTELRQSGASTGPQPNEIDRDFLAALPPELQAELIRSETQHRQRREREEVRARAVVSGNTGQPQAEDMNNADFMAMLPLELRYQVLLEADETTLAALPAEIQAEARAMATAQRQNREAEQAFAARQARHERHLARHRQRLDAEGAIEVSRPRRPVIQILDKPGVATLLCLMFVALQGTAKTVMLGILSDVCKNTQNRAEVISIILSILQDGSHDSSALERSYAQLKIRSRQTPGTKTPQPTKRLAPQSLGDVSPAVVLQSCLSTLTLLANHNPRVSSFFLSEHETVLSMRAKTIKKGKAKDTKAVKYPINALLALLDRSSITDNVTIMEDLAALLVKVTEPLKLLLRRSKEVERDGGPANIADTTSTPLNESNALPAVAQSTADTADVPMSGTPRLEAPAEIIEASDQHEKKKPKHLAPPEIPEENLCLVINILAARECPSRTFSSTLEIINHLAAIPGARDVFGAELVRRAQELGTEILEDLAQLPQQIKDAESSIDVQGMTIARFSSGSSHQNKLLRMLVVLDYIYDARRSREQSASGDEKIPQAVKEDLVSTLYESETFIKVWDLLSDCLATLRLRGNMNNIATILQPLIESFMVVCKNTASLNNSVAESASGTPAPESRIAKLFIKFTEEHRKILNDLVRHNPKLMSGTFDVLIRNPKVLDFDNKRSFFSKRLRARTDTRSAYTSLQLSVRREAILEDSFKALNYKLSLIHI